MTRHFARMTRIAVCYESCNTISGNCILYFCTNITKQIGKIERQKMLIDGLTSSYDSTISQ